MRPLIPQHLRTVAATFAAVVLLLALIPWNLTPRPAQAQVSQGGNFGSAVPCILGESTFATTCVADTISNPAPASDPAIVQFSANGKGALAPLGSRVNNTASSTIANGVGSTYGLAYDDGAVSGRRRLLAAAYTKRLVSFGSGGPGGIYEYNYNTNTWSLAATVPGAWSGAGRSATDFRDRSVIGQVGKTGLGDMEISPDGRTLYVVNLASRQIERFDISGGPLVRQTPLNIPFGLISGAPAVQNDLRPFALEFYPNIIPNGPALVVGVTDTAQRGGSATTSIHLIAHFIGNGSWGMSLSQSLVVPVIEQRFHGSSYRETWETIFRDWNIRSWNSWTDNIDSAPARTTGTQATLLYPQPILADIEFNRDGSMMYLGLRDRSGDQAYLKNAPQPEKINISQGDTLAYQLVGGAWQLQTVNRIDPINEDDATDRMTAVASDYFNDSLHSYGEAAAPAHNENHQGALATSLQGGPAGFTERVIASTLLGFSRSGYSVYNQAGGQRAYYTQLIAAGDAGGSKTTTLGDVELLCTYAFIGGRVWQDNNNNGVQDIGEASFANITLELFKGNDANAPALARATTGADGRYVFAVEPNIAFNVRIARTSFQGAAAGWYLTRANSGGNDTTDSDAHRALGYIEFFGGGIAGTGVTGIPAAVRLRESDERTFDIGLTRVAPTGVIGDRVWNDANSNGLQDSGEQGIGNVLVTLERDPNSAAPALQPYPRTTRTAANGTYNFNNTEPGSYRVLFSVPTGYSPTRINAGDDTRDSDADAGSGYRTGLITIDAPPNDVNQTIDFGLISSSVDVSVTKTGPAQVLVGQAFSYTITYRNAGAGVANNVSIIDTLPAGVTYISATPAPSAISGSTITWNLGQLAVNQQGSITLNVRAPATLTAPATSQSVTNRVTITTTSTDTTPGNNTSTHTTQVVRPEVGISKTAPASVLVGDEFTFSLAYNNSGSIAAANVVINDTLPAGLRFTRFLANPSGACAYTNSTRQIRCAFATLPAGTGGTVQFATRVDVTATGMAVSNTATISTSTAGDNPNNNSSTSTTTVLRPNPGVGITITPSPFPVGSSGTVTVTYRNTGNGTARSSTLTVVLTAGTYTLGTLPGGCTYTAASRTITCSLGDLPAGATGTLSFPITLPATFVPDSLGGTVSISTTTPERAADLADNAASISVQVVRPNVYVDASGPSEIVAQGSVFWYVVDYGNIYRRNPALTRAAQNVILRATLPDDVTYLNANTAPTTVSGNVLTWNLGTLSPRQTGQMIIVVQTDVPAGAVLDFEAVISTTTPGDDPADNRDTVVTNVVQPPSDIPNAGGDLRLAIHSELDPNSRDSNPTNGVYVSDGTQISWPAGEVLDFTPRLQGLVMDGEPLPWPYEYRAKVVGWSVAGFEINGVAHNPAGADSRGRSGCRPGASTNGAPQQLAGCAYGYIGGDDLDAINAPATLREEQMRDQAHVYWTQPPAPAMRDDVYLYTVDPLAPVKMTIELEIEVWIVNAYPGAPIDDPTIPEIPVVPLPDAERRTIAATFDVTLLVPRSVVGPGSITR